MMRLIGLFGLLVALAVGVSSNPVLAQADLPPTSETPTVLTITDDEVNAVARHLFCPVCESEPLNTCLAPTCFEWRAEIRDQLSQGRTEQQIIDYFVAEAGQQVVGLPQDDGLRLLSIGAPIVIGVIALGIGLFTIRRWRGRTSPITQAPLTPENALDDDYRARLERDLNDL
jgi:cytochrome c-type biogenesis protein CcmH